MHPASWFGGWAPVVDPLTSLAPTCSNLLSTLPSPFPCAGLQSRAKGIGVGSSSPRRRSELLSHPNWRLAARRLLVEQLEVTAAEQNPAQPAPYPPFPDPATAMPCYACRSRDSGFPSRSLHRAQQDLLQQIRPIFISLPPSAQLGTRRAYPIRSHGCKRCDIRFRAHDAMPNRSCRAAGFLAHNSIFFLCGIRRVCTRNARLLLATAA